jgi:outer membrane protein assembly factor BamB
MRAALAALVATSLACLAGCAGDDEGGGASASQASSSSSESSPGSRSAAATSTELDSGAVGIADVGGSAWLVQPDSGTVVPGDGEPVKVGAAPLRIVDTPAGPWVSVIEDGTVVRLDPDTGAVQQKVALKPAGSEPEGLAWDGESLWVVDQAHARVVQLSPQGDVLDSVGVDDEPRLDAAGESGIWVASYGGSSVSLLRADRGRGDPARTVQLVGCVGPQGIGEAAGKVWVSCTLSSKVIALDARSLKQVVEIPDVTDADAIVVDGGTVYAVGQSGPTVWVIDAASGKVRDTIALDDAPATRENVGAAVVGKNLVVTHPDVRRVYTLPLP